MKTVIEMAREAEHHASSVQPFTIDVGVPNEAWIVERDAKLAELIRADERNSWPAEMEAMERQVNILTDALAQEREAIAKWLENEKDAPYWAELVRARSNT